MENIKTQVYESFRGFIMKIFEIIFTILAVFFFLYIGYLIMIFLIGLSVYLGSIIGGWL